MAMIQIKRPGPWGTWHVTGARVLHSPFEASLMQAPAEITLAIDMDQRPQGQAIEVSLVLHPLAGPERTIALFGGDSCCSRAVTC